MQQQSQNFLIFSAGFAATVLALSYCNPAAQTRTLALQTAPDKPEDCRISIYIFRY